MANGWLSGIVPRLPDDVPVLSDGVITLRPHLAGDIPRMVQACRDLESRRWLPLPAPYDEQDARDFLEAKRTGRAAGTSIEWAVEAAGRWVGNIGLHDPRGDTFEVGYLMHPDARGGGLGRAALGILTAHAFDAMGLSGLAWRAARGNFASWRLAWSEGFTLDGTWPVPHPVSDGGTVDAMWMGHLHAADPREPRTPWWEPPVLDGGRFIVRPWRDDDTPRAEPDALSAPFLHDLQPTPASYPEWLLARREQMATGKGIYWCIADPDIDEPLGYLAIQDLQVALIRGTGQLSYWLYPAWRGLGLLQEALDVVIAHAFSPVSDRSGGSGLGLHRLQAGCDLANRPSVRALRRAGFRQVAQERAVLAHADRAPTAALTFELLAGDDRLAQSIEPAVLPTLRTARLVLRPWSQDDQPNQDVELDRLALRYMPPGAQPTHSTWEEWFDRRVRQVETGQFTWCIADGDTGQALGSVALFSRDGPVTNRAELGYWLYPDARGQGLAGEAIDVALTFAFTPASKDGLGLTRISAETDAENTASRNLLRARNFTLWGAARGDYTRSDGSVGDSAYYELLSADFEPDKS